MFDVTIFLGKKFGLKLEKLSASECFSQLFKELVIRKEEFYLSTSSCAQLGSKIMFPNLHDKR